MSTAVPGSDILTGVLDAISQSLSIPVLVILLILVIISIVVLGGFISEYTSRKKVGVSVISDGIFNISSAASIEDLKGVIHNMNIPKSQKRILIEMAGSRDLDNMSREALARKLVENEEEKIDKSLEKTDIITRIGPTLGLMGTLIPMGPGLAALGSGDINLLAESLTVAFNTTIVGIGSGALCYVLSKIRRRWYDNYISDLDALSDAVLDYMNKQ